MTSQQAGEGSRGGEASCLSCGEPRLRVVPGSENIPGVTSDCRPWPATVGLCLCEGCGLVQKQVNEVLRNQVNRIYEGYTLYGQSAGNEQLVFSEGSGIGSGRSPHLISALRSFQPLPERGRLLDVGCGNGPWLHAWSRVFPKWSLVGFDLTEKYRREIVRIKNVEDHYTGDISQVPGRFDLISMIHTLEHMFNPIPFLTLLRSKLNPGGRLFIQVPDHQSNPFDLLIVDHVMHFNRQSLLRMLSFAGWMPHEMREQTIRKEISVIALDESGRGPQKTLSEKEVLSLWSAATRRIQWLVRLVKNVQRLFPRHELGLFGTSIAGTWLCRLLGERVTYFVDEDPDRVGKTHMNRPILHPHQLKTGKNVLVCLTPTTAIPIIERLSRPGVRYHSLPH